MKRRTVLAALSTGIVGFGGCLGESQSPPPENETATGTGTSGSRSPTTANLPSSSTEDKRIATTFAPKDHHSEAGFGHAIAVSSDGSIALVGVPHGNSVQENTGSAYVFLREANSWTRQAKLAADDVDTDHQAGDEFGYSVAVSRNGTAALVGAPHEQDLEGPQGGAAYVYQHENGSWTQQVRLLSVEGTAGDHFGNSVAITAEGSTALVGKPGKEGSETETPGSVHVFEREGANWTREATLRPQNRDTAVRFGDSVAVAADGTRALVGATGTMFTAEPADTAFVFRRSGGSWTQEAKLTPENGDPDNDFGDAVTMTSDGSTAIVGASSVDSSSTWQAGAAFIFEDDDGWIERARLTPPRTQESMGFGATVAATADGSAVVIGAPGFDRSARGSDHGSAYVFEQNGDSWTPRWRLLAADGELRDGFGSSVATSNDGSTTLIGAADIGGPKVDSGGRVYAIESRE